MAVDQNGISEGTSLLSNHRGPLERRIKDEAEARRVKFETKRKVQEERRGLDVRCIRIFKIRYSCVVKEVVAFFQQYGEVLEANLFPMRNPHPERSEQKHSGTGQIEFASSETVQKLQQMLEVRVDDSGKCILHSNLGHGGFIKFEALRPHTVKRQLKGANKPLFTAVSFQMGNLVGDNKAIYSFDIDCPTDVKLQDRSITWEMTYEGKRYKFELGLKHVRGKAMLQPMKGDRAALLLPVRIPPKVFRLNIQQGAGDQMEALTSSLLPMDNPWANYSWNGVLSTSAAICYPDGFASAFANPVKSRGLASGHLGNQGADVDGVARNGRVPRAQAIRTTSHAESDATRWYIHPDDWKRTVDFTPLNAIGTSFLYRFVLPYTVDELQNQYRSVLAGLWDYHILNEVLIFRPTDMKQDYLGHQDGVDELLATLPFMVYYHLECLLTGGYICWQQVTFELALLLKHNKEDIGVQAMSFMLVERQRVTNPTARITTLMDEIQKDARYHRSVARVLPEHCMMLGRVLATPTRLVRLPPETEVSNRVLRHFVQYKDRFIRVAFGEESSSKLFMASGRQHNADLKRRMEEILADGITVGGRHFEFLAFSTSQLKEHSTWFFAPLPEFPTDRVRQWMGSFDDVKCAAKYANRMGLCFSSTFDTIDVKAQEMDIIPDIQRNGYTFSDGVGQISPMMAEEVANVLKQHGRLSPHLKTNPSAYQLRLQGCKGVLVVNPALSGYKLLVRPSMRKFSTSTTSMLEVANQSRFLPGYLNRQFISLLYKNSLGVPDEIFRSMQDDMLSDLNGMLVDGITALKVLREYEGTDADGLVNHLGAMITAGFDVAKEPYLRGLLAAIRAHLLQDLKNKTKIFVPDSAVVIGVMDENASLQYGQVFLMVDKSPLQDAPQIIKGPFIVAKNPCFHPGDIRVLEAVDVPELHHLRNVVVFPQLGPRPHSNEISGSDLDGDLYFCCWDPRLLPPRISHPMEFPTAQPKMLEEVTIKDVADFFVDHAINDNLGIIANAHLALCDQSERGAFDPKCLELAKLHSYAVDFPRTGMVVEIPSHLRANKFPDFMWNKRRKHVYYSSTIIGRLFREIEDPVEPFYTQQKEQSANIAKISEDQNLAQSNLDPDVAVEGFEAYLEDALRQRVLYERQLIQIMNQFNIFSESELVSGCIVAFSKLHRRSNGKRFDAKKHITDAVQALRKKFLGVFDTDLAEEQNAEGSDHQGTRRKASAWYHVTYSPAYINLGSDPSVQLFSFAWVVGCHLAEIKRSKREPVAESRRQHKHSDPYELHMDQEREQAESWQQAAKEAARPSLQDEAHSTLLPDRRQAYDPFLGQLDLTKIGIHAK